MGKYELGGGVLENSLETELDVVREIMFRV